MNPILLEDYFHPGFKTKPAVHVGSQSLKFFHNNPKEQAWEGFHLVSSSQNDVAVVRDYDPNYLSYWKSLMGDVRIINISKHNPGEYLSQTILNDHKIIDSIKEKLHSNSKLMVFLPTEIESQLAQKLNIPLHGSPHITNRYGTKSGIRKLANEFDIPMPTGFICSTIKEISQAIEFLKNDFPQIVIKHDDSVSGLFSQRFNSHEVKDIKEVISKLIKTEFKDKQHTFVVEGWVNSTSSLCAHIEILENQKPIICAAWQQLIDSDNISYIGSGPLMLTPKALSSFLKSVHKLADALKKKGAVGSYGPDFIITEDDTSLLIELNARTPYTALFLESLVQVKGKIGNGFASQHITTPKKISFTDIKEILQKEKLLITQKGENIQGVIPFNIGLLKWNLFDVGIVADSWEHASWLRKKTKSLFS